MWSVGKVRRALSLLLLSVASPRQDGQQVLLLSMRTLQRTPASFGRLRSAKHTMANLPTSLRRTMLMLLVGMCMIVMVFYWNQSTLKPQSSSYSAGAAFRRMVQNNPTENYWTYRCDGEKCIREHFTEAAGGATKRIPFMSCAMICGEPNIWPMPTGFTKVSSRSLTLSAAAAQLHVDTPHAPVRELLQSAFELFVEDLQLLEANAAPTTPSSSSSAEASRASKRNGRSSSGAGGAPVASDPAAAAAKDPNCAKDELAAELEQQHEQQKQLLAQRLLLADVKQLNVRISVTASAEVHLNLETDESYNLELKTDRSTSTVHIQAASFFGARHALATLAQLIWFDDSDALLRILSTARVSDEPRFRYRGLMLDTSRHYFSVDAIKRTIVGMAAAKLNRFHWHITDTQSFPYASAAYPQMAQSGAYSAREIYTVADVREVARFARVRGVQVLPEIDAPAHAGNGWDWGPRHGLGELSLCINQQPWSFYCGEPPCGQLNPRNNHTYAILQRLYGELLEATGPTDYFHLGGDEVNLECWQQHFNDTDARTLWCDFMLQAYARLRVANGGRSPRVVAVWSSGLTQAQCLSSAAFAVQVWGGSSWPENFELLASGFQVVLSHVDAWYLDCGFGSWRSTGEGACSPYRTWQQIYRHRPWDRMHVEEGRLKQILGGEACMWTEQVDENALDTRLWPRTAALAERLWTDPVEDREVEALPQQVFNRFSVFRSRLVDLGLKAEPIFPKFCAQNQNECN